MAETSKTILFVDQYVGSALKSVKKYFGDDTKILLLRDKSHHPHDAKKEFRYADEVCYVDFSKSYDIAAALVPYQASLIAVTARTEEGANKLRSVIPHVPYLRTPTQESILWSTDKYEMRRRFKLYDPTITPKFTKVKGNTKEERERIIQKIKFPMVIKPANLQESMLVSICYHEEELERTLKNVFRRLKAEYTKYNRAQLPTILAEQFMDGEMYSVDAYVNSRGKVYFCPFVHIKTGRNIGHDDFYNYLQVTPTLLKKRSTERAQEVAEKAVHALGLRSITAHIELMRIDDEWKVIEVGPRVGGFRDTLHKLSCDIDHSLNDVLIRIPKTPIIPKRCKGHSAAMKWFAKTEGVIQAMNGIKKLESLESFHSIVFNKKVGDKALFSKNGGKSIFNLILNNPDHSKLLADIRRVEQLVKIKVK